MNDVPTVQFDGGEVTCNSSPERCEQYYGGYCGMRKANGNLPAAEDYFLSSATLYARCGMGFVSTDSITDTPPASPTPTT